MKSDICFVYPYYENPSMLRKQMENWNAIAEMDPTFKVVLVDDNSQQHPAYDIFKEGKFTKELYRFKDPAFWTMHECRNLGAMIGGEGYPWLFMSDIDIILYADQYKKLQEFGPEPQYNYTFERYMSSQGVHDEEVLTLHRYHCNTYLLRRDAYMQINGYDVDYCGAHGGGYGGDGTFERQLSRVTPRYHLEDIFVVGHERTAVADANTTQWDREEGKLLYRKVFDKKRKRGDLNSYNPIRRNWERII